MNVWDIVKTVGAGALNVMLPGAGSAVIGAVNMLLPDEAKLPENATGHDVSNAIHSLPPEQRAEIMGKEFDVKITDIKESHSTARAMLEAESRSTHSTRPKIAYQAFQVVSAISLAIAFGWLYAVVTSQPDMVKQIVDGWPWVGAIILPFVGWLNRYFGILKLEHKNRLDAANGVSNPDGITSILSSVFGGKK